VQDANTLSLEAEATHIPERIIVDVTDAEDGTRIHAGDVKLPEGSTLISDPELLVLSVTTPSAPTADDRAADEAAAEAGAEAGEGGAAEAESDAAESTEAAE